MTAPHPDLVDSLLQRELRSFEALHPNSRAAFERGQAHYLYGAPSHWMRRWAGGFPIAVKEAQGTTVVCVDDREYVDFCLGDTGGMCGHANASVAQAVADQLRRGATLMLPTLDAEWVGQELQRRFALPYWGFTTSASDSNRAAIRIARMVTGREKVLVFNGCYHGSIEEAHVAFGEDGSIEMRNGIHPNAVDHGRLSRLVEFNDAQGLERALASRDVACVLTEPFMTNYGMVAAAPGFHAAMRAATRAAGTLLVMDETHTLSCGPGGATREEGLEPDILVLGKAVGGGVPVGLYGLSESVAQSMWQLVPKVKPTEVRQSAHLGFGGTLAGSALQVAAVRSVLEHVLTEAAFARMIGLSETLADKARETIASHALPWYVEQIGARVEIMFAPQPPRNATDVKHGRDGKLESLLHVYFMNRGVLITPFHCMLLACPASGERDSERFIEVLQGFCGELSSPAY